MFSKYFVAEKILKYFQKFTININSTITILNPDNQNKFNQNNFEYRAEIAKLMICIVNMKKLQLVKFPNIFKVYSQDKFNQNTFEYRAGKVMTICIVTVKTQEAYIVPDAKNLEKVPRERYLSPLVFHDGRLAMRPTPFISLIIFLWLPVGFILAITRVAIGVAFPPHYAVPLVSLLGVKIRVQAPPPLREQRQLGMLFVCTHRCLMDPVFLSLALRRKITALTYSVSKMSEILSPIKTVRLSRSRSRDAKLLRSVLERNEDLVVCPEGTTCREPYLLRFSPLFAEVGETIIPVAVNVRMEMFYATTARGWKSMDSVFFLMNPNPCYEIIFLDPLPQDMSCAAGKSSIEVANYIQKQLAQVLGFQCTSLTRKDKYMVLAGTDGSVRS